jgi:hypothetical protein
VTSSPLAEGLLEPEISEIWTHFREGYMIHVRAAAVTPEMRSDAKEHWRQFAIKSEQRMPITMMTVATHFGGAEADKQIEYVGKIRDSVSSWIERVCGNLVEETRRRRICVSPEKTMIRSFLVKHYLKTHESLLPFVQEEQRDVHLYDVEGEDRSKVCSLKKNFG